MFRGAFTAIVTPMTSDGSVDLERLRSFVDFQISEGISGLVPCGTTGETPTLSDEEQAQVIKTTVEQTAGRVPVIAGAGANNTAKAIKQSQMARECGVDALLHVAPYYNKPTQRGMLAHFTAIADASDLPIVLYNVPGRTGSDLLPQTIAELATHERIVAVKEATGSVARGQAVIQAVPSNFAVLSGDDALTFALTAAGGAGVISVVTNVAPRRFTQMVKKLHDGDLAGAREDHYALLPLIDQLFVESNPIPVKAAVAKVGHTENVLRPPLHPMSEEHRADLDALLKRLGIVS